MVIEHAWAVSARRNLHPALTATWADRDHMQAYFGVTAEQSHATTLCAYTPTSGCSKGAATMGAAYESAKSSFPCLNRTLARVRISTRRYGFASRTSSGVFHLKLVPEQLVMRSRRLRNFLPSRHLFAGGRCAHPCRNDVPLHLRPVPLSLASSPGVARGSSRGARLSGAKVPRWALPAARQAARCTTLLHPASTVEFRRILTSLDATKPPISGHPNIGPRPDLRLTFTRQDGGLMRLPARLPIDASGTKYPDCTTRSMDVGTAFFSLLVLLRPHPMLSKDPL